MRWAGVFARAMLLVILWFWCRLRRGDLDTGLIDNLLRQLKRRGGESQRAVLAPRARNMPRLKVGRRAKPIR